MIKHAWCLSLLLGLFSGAVVAEEQSIEDQIAAIQDKIKEQEEFRQQLKNDLTSKDEEVAKLKEQLKALEEQIGG